MFLQYVSQRFSFKLLLALTLLSGITPAQATISPISHFLLQHQKEITLQAKESPFSHSLNNFIKSAQFSPTDNKLFRLYSTQENIQTLQQQHNFIEQDDSLNPIMLEIIKQIKFNAAWSEKRKSVFLILFLVLTVMCIITFNLWRQLGRQYASMRPQ